MFTFTDRGCVDETLEMEHRIAHYTISRKATQITVDVLLVLCAGALMFSLLRSVAKVRPGRSGRRRGCFVPLVTILRALCLSFKPSRGQLGPNTARNECT